jgi:hypothetical protein
MTDPQVNKAKRELKDAADTTENRLEEAADNVRDA